MRECAIAGTEEIKIKEIRKEIDCTDVEGMSVFVCECEMGEGNQKSQKMLKQ